MIVINNPQIETKEEEVLLYSDIEFNSGTERLWYKLPLKFQEYLVIENADAFVVGLLFLALKKGEDIELKTPISARLHYTLTHYLIPALCLANPKLHKIRIIAKQVNASNLNKEKVAGCGLSCGVDSFATYYQHIDETGPFKIEYFTFLNAGSLGDFGGENTQNTFSG